MAKKGFPTLTELKNMKNTLWGVVEIVEKKVRYISFLFSSSSPPSH